MKIALLWNMAGLAGLVFSTVEVANGRLGFAPILVAAILSAFHGANLIGAPSAVPVRSNRD